MGCPPSPLELAREHIDPARLLPGERGLTSATTSKLVKQSIGPLLLPSDSSPVRLRRLQCMCAIHRTAISPCVKTRAARRSTRTYQQNTQYASMVKQPYTPHGPFDRPSNV